MKLKDGEKLWEFACRFDFERYCYEQRNEKQTVHELEKEGDLVGLMKHLKLGDRKSVV